MIEYPFQIQATIQKQLQQQHTNLTSVGSGKGAVYTYLNIQYGIEWYQMFEAYE